MINLPNDIICLIISYTSVDDVTNIYNISKYYRYLLYKSDIHLYIINEQVKNTKILNTLKNIVNITIIGARISNLNINSSKLKNLTLNKCQITNNDVDFDFPNLEKLSLSNNVKFKNIKFNTPVLKNLNLCNTGINNNDLYEISKINTLTTLNISRCCYIYLSHYLNNLTNLIDLNIEDTAIRDISFLEKMNSLKILNIANCEIDNFSVLKNLQLTYLNASGYTTMVDAILSNMVSLEKLRIGGYAIFDCGNTIKLNNLKVLDLSHCSGFINIHMLNENIEYLYVNLIDAKGLNNVSATIISKPRY